MKNYRRRLPPLDALVVFEAVMRHGGFTRAATELYVTQAAVSKRIKQLELHLAAPLFVRHGRTVRPTAAARVLHERVSAGLEFLASACEAAGKGPATDSLTVAANTAVSHFWLAPALQGLQQDHDGLAVRMVVSDRSADLMADDIDFAVLYGRSDQPGWRLHPLLEEELVPVASSAYLERLGMRFEDLRLDDCVVLDYDRLEPDWINWSSFAQMAKLDAAPRIARRFNNYALLVSAALAGEGVILGSLPLLRRELESGQLVAVSSSRVHTGRSYSLAHRIENPPEADGKRLFDWLLRAAGRDRTGP
ncbi:MAG: LysR substrate-binding domain-containing protein [Pseudomonadota bacterium]